MRKKNPPRRYTRAKSARRREAKGLTRKSKFLGIRNIIHKIRIKPMRIESTTFRKKSVPLHRQPQTPPPHTHKHIDPWGGKETKGERKKVKRKGRSIYKTTYCLCRVGLINEPIKTAHIIPRPANVQYAFTNKPFQSTIFAGLVCGWRTSASTWGLLCMEGPR